MTSPVDVTTTRERGVWRQYLRAVGPGLVTGASDDDPSAIATYASAGAQTGLGLLWTCLVCFPLMVAVQLNSDRAALATGKTFGELVRSRFSARGRRLFVGMLIVHLFANVLVTAADLVAVGAGLNLLGLGPTWVWALVAGIAISGLLVSGSFSAIARVLKILCVTLLAYVAVLFVVDVGWGEVATRLVVPSFDVDAESLQLLVAVLGATLPPYVFFWQNVHRLEELREEPAGGDHPVPLPRRRRRDALQKERTSTLDVVVGMVFAVLVMFGVMVSLAVTVGADGPREIASAADAAAALEPVAGNMAKALFAAGFVAAGVLAVPVLAGAAAANLSGVLGRRWGFSQSVREAPEFYGLVLVATAAGTALALTEVDAITLLVTAATINGITAAPLMAVVMKVSGDRELLGAHRPRAAVRVLGWAAVAMMATVSVVAVGARLAG